jgi:hypothetical protein
VGISRIRIIFIFLNLIQVSQVKARKLEKGGKNIVVDVDAVLEEMQFIGDGIVDRIELTGTKLAVVK